MKGDYQPIFKLHRLTIIINRPQDDLKQQVWVHRPVTRRSVGLASDTSIPSGHEHGVRATESAGQRGEDEGNLLISSSTWIADFDQHDPHVMMLTCYIMKAGSSPASVTVGEFIRVRDVGNCKVWLL